MNENRQKRVRKEESHIENGGGEVALKVQKEENMNTQMCITFLRLKTAGDQNF